MKKYWWVNQNQTYKQEVEGGYLWSPKTKRNGSRNPFYDTMPQVQPGDLVFSFSKTYIKAIGTASETATTAPKPVEFGTAGANWSNTGWHVPVDFVKVSNPIRPKDHMGRLRPTLPKKYSPLQAKGNGNQTVYLAEVPEAMAAILLELLGSDAINIASASVTQVNEAADNRAEREIQDRPDIAQTTKEQMIQARRGQGQFRSRVERIERGCRVTGLSIGEHLRASHIKPWRDSTDSEKLWMAQTAFCWPHTSIISLTAGTSRSRPTARCWYPHNCRSKQRRPSAFRLDLGRSRSLQSRLRI
jgi:putative restriction endonuclease